MKCGLSMRYCRSKATTRERFPLGLALTAGAQRPESKHKGVWREQREAIRQPRDRLRGQPQERSLIADGESTPF
jgi:hypothetical protein